jgi:hypothetical protein
LNVEYTLGDPEDVMGLYTTRKTTLWIHNLSSKVLNINAISYRRVCRFQKNCLLFRYFLKAGTIQNTSHCPCSGVTDIEFELDGFKSPPDNDKGKIISRLEWDGLLELDTSQTDIPPHVWRCFGCPFKLRVGKLHILELVTHSKFYMQDAPAALRLLYRVTNPIGGSSSFSRTKVLRLHIDLRDNKFSEASKSEWDESVCPDHGLVFSYNPRVSRMNELLGNLQAEFISYFSKEYPKKHISAEEIKLTLEKKLGEKIRGANILFTNPPNAKYETTSVEGMKAQMRVWVPFREFCKEFLDCEQFAQLGRLFALCLFHPYYLPRIILYTHGYLLISSHNLVVGLKFNLKKRTRVWPIALFFATKNELNFLASELHQRRGLKRSIDYIAKDYQNQKGLPVASHRNS